MKILIASDSYKGSLDTFQIASCIEQGARKALKDVQCRRIPVSDGGEGTVAAVVNGKKGKMLSVEVTGPLGTPVQADLGILPGEEAVIEMAAASGLPLVPREKRDIMKATTFGTGQLILEAMNQNCRKIYIGIGGSATNDGGIGMAQALGVSFKDAQGKEVGYGGGELARIASVDESGLDPRIRETDIIVMCDVTNPLCGESGAAAVYGPQKGADADQIQQLDEGLAHLDRLIEKAHGKSLKDVPGAGAAGGLGLGLMAFAGAKLQSGIETILELYHFEELLEWADLVITGEGKIDGQSVCGKVLSGIAGKAEKKDKPVLAIAGSLAPDAKRVFEIGISGIEAAVCRPMELQAAIEQTELLVEEAAERAIRMIHLGTRM